MERYAQKLRQLKMKKARDAIMADTPSVSTAAQKEKGLFDIRKIMCQSVCCVWSWS
jgi:hypothetical protein